MGPQNVAILRPLMIIGYALAATDIVLSCYYLARVLRGRLRKLSRRQQTLSYLVIGLLIAPSAVLSAIGPLPGLPSAALIGDIGAIGGLTGLLLLLLIQLLL